MPPQYDNLGHMLQMTSRQYPRRPALFTSRGIVTYRKLNRMANLYAHAYRQRLGCSPGNRVALLLENREEYVYACFGAFKAGLSVIPLNHFLAAPELRYILEDARVSILLSSDRFAAVVRGLSKTLPWLNTRVTVGREDLGNETWLSEELLRGMPENEPGDVVGRDTLATVIYTSGTTGKPKGAMLSHGNLLSNISSAGACIKVKKRDRLLLILPMFHSFTLTVCILMPVAFGASSIVVGKLTSLQHVFREALLRRATIFIGIPHLYEVVAEKGMGWWMKVVLRLRLCVSGSAPLPEATLQKFEKRIGIPLLEGYGLSEASPVVSINPLDGKRKAGSVGLPIPGVEVKIVSGKGEDLPQGRVGEIAVRGPNVMRGYLNRPRETKETIRGGWLLTGDVGRIDEEGYIYILDRKKDMLLCHGMNVYPREIEEVLYGHPAIAEAAVIGQPDKRRGEVPVAYISHVKGASVTPSEVVRYCKQYLAGYKVPHRVVLMEKLPRNATGKIMKKELRNNCCGLDNR